MSNQKTIGEFCFQFIIDFFVIELDFTKAHDFVNKFEFRISNLAPLLETLAGHFFKFG